MLPRCPPITNTSWLPTPSPAFSILFRHFSTPTHYFASVSPSKASLCVDEECSDILPWLKRKAGMEISSVLAIGTSSFGRSLYASDYIREGDCILKVPYSVQWPEIISLQKSVAYWEILVMLPKLLCSFCSSKS